MTNGNPMNGWDTTGKDDSNGVVSNLMSKTSQESNGNSNGTGVVSNLMSQGSKSIKTFVESPVKKFLNPEAGQNIICSRILI